jgi:hypothetical protein
MLLLLLQQVSAPHLAKVIVRHLVHQAVEHRLTGRGAHSVLTLQHTTNRSASLVTIECAHGSLLVPGSSCHACVSPGNNSNGMPIPPKTSGAHAVGSEHNPAFASPSIALTST